MPYARGIACCRACGKTAEPLSYDKQRVWLKLAVLAYRDYWLRMDNHQGQPRGILFKFDAAWSGGQAVRSEDETYHPGMAFESILQKIGDSFRIRDRLGVSLKAA